MADLVERLRAHRPAYMTVGTELILNEAADRLTTLEAEAHENARLLGMGGEREANMAGEIERLKRQVAALEAEASKGERTVPIIPTEAMWGGLARDIVMWWSFDRPTGAALHQHLRMLGREIPDWLEKEVPSIAHVPAKGDVATAIYRAMLDAALIPEASVREANPKDDPRYPAVLADALARARGENLDGSPRREALPAPHQDNREA